MTAYHLSAALAALLQATKDGDRRTFLSLFADDAIVADAGIEHRGRAGQAWVDRLMPGNAAVRPINVVRSDDKAVVTVVTIPSAAGADASQFDWSLRVVAGRIAAFTVTPSVLPDLPGPVSEYVRASNAFDLARLLRAFADDAVVNDQLREYRGKAAIAEWAARDIVGSRMTMYVVDVLEHPGNAVVSANVDGDFDRRGLPDPLVLAFYFTFHSGKIDQLIILRNEPEI